jgi:hypothetical protein
VCFIVNEQRVANHRQAEGRDKPDILRDVRRFAVIDPMIPHYCMVYVVMHTANPAFRKIRKSSSNIFVTGNSMYLDDATMYAVHENTVKYGGNREFQKLEENKRKFNFHDHAASQRAAHTRDNTRGVAET